MADADSTGARPLPNTTARIAAIPLSPEDRVEYQHQRLPSLRLRVGRVKSWLVMKRINGRWTRHTIGRFPEVGLADAERQAQALIGQVATETYVSKSVARARSMTLQQAFDGYLAFRLTGAKPIKERTVKDYTVDMRMSFDDWMSRPVASITAADVQRRHAKRSEVTPSRADGGMRVLRAVLRWAADQSDAPIERIPTTKLRGRWNGAKRKTGHLTPEQMPAWFAAAGARGGTGRALQLLALTGCRRNEILGLPLDQVDQTARTITIAENKASRPVTLPLSTLAAGVIAAQVASLPKGTRWLFPQSADPTKPLTEPRAAHRAACIAAGADPDLDIHALRRTFSTAANRFGGVYTIKRLMNHAANKNDVTEGYVQIDIAEMRRVADCVAAMYQQPQVSA